MNRLEKNLFCQDLIVSSKAANIRITDGKTFIAANMTYIGISFVNMYKISLLQNKTSVNYTERAGNM